MIVEIEPETEQLVREEIRRGHVHSLDQIIVEGISALREKAAPSRKPRKKLYDLLTQAPFAGSELDLRRDKIIQGPSICDRLSPRHKRRLNCV